VDENMRAIAQALIATQDELWARGKLEEEHVPAFALVVFRVRSSRMKAKG